METVHRLLHAAREALDLSQTDVAKATNVSTRTIHRMESEQGIVGFDILGRLRSHFESLGVTLIAPVEREKWAITFSTELAPLPSPDAADDLYHPVPGRVLRAARVLAGLTQAELAARSSIAHTTVRRLERGGNVGAEKVYLLQRAIEEQGVEFSKPLRERPSWTLRR